MIDLHTYVLFIGAVVLLVIVPGPDMAFLLIRTIAQGRKAGALAAIGINAGAYVHVLAVVLGLAAVLAASSVAFTIIKWLGVCYLIWIGIRAIVSQSGRLNLAIGQSVELKWKSIFWQGFLSDLLNPKVAIFFLAFLPQFVDVNNPSITATQQLLLLGVTSNVIAICMNLMIVYFAGAATMRLRQNQKIVARLNKAMGAVFIALGIRLATEKL